MKCPGCGLGDLEDWDDPKDPGAALAACYPQRLGGTSCGAIFTVRLEHTGDFRWRPFEVTGLSRNFTEVDHRA